MVKQVSVRVKDGNGKFTSLAIGVEPQHPDEAPLHVLLDDDPLGTPKKSKGGEELVDTPTKTVGPADKVNKKKLQEIGARFLNEMAEKSDNLGAVSKVSRGKTYELRQLATTCVEGIPLGKQHRYATRLKFKTKRGSGKADGTKKGGNKRIISVDDFDNLMEPETKAIRKFSFTKKRPFRAVQEPVKRVFQKVKGINLRVAYTTMCRYTKLRTGRRGYTTGRKETDKCPICYAYDKSVRPNTVQYLGDLKQEMTKLHPDFWQPPMGQSLEFDNVEAPNCFKDIHGHLEMKSVEYKEMDSNFGDKFDKHIKKVKALDKEFHGHRFHWAMKVTFQGALREDLINPQVGWIYLWMDAAENLNGPRGPCEPSETFRANARFSFSFFSCKMWSWLSKEKSTMISHISRVLEKGGYYSTLLLDDILQRLVDTGVLDEHLKEAKAVGIKTLTLGIWTDAGPGYCNTIFLSSLNIYFPMRYKVNMVHNKGLGSHLKGDVDTYFSVCDARLDAAEKTTWLVYSNDFVKALLDYRSMFTFTDEIIIDYTPTISRDAWKAKLQLIKRTSLPALQSAAHCFEFILKDKRRRSLKQRKCNTINGVEVRARPWPHGPLDAKGYSELAPAGTKKVKEAPVAVATAVVVAKPLEDAVDGCASDSDSSGSSEESSTDQELQDEQNEILGWKCSYRKRDPEKPKREKIAARLFKKIERIEKYLDQLPMATVSRRPPVEDGTKVSRCSQRKQILKGRFSKHYAAVRRSHRENAKLPPMAPPASRPGSSND